MEVMKLIKVLYLLNHAGQAGTEEYVESLVKRLDGKYTKAYFSYNEEGLLVEKMKALGVETFRVEMRNPFDIGAAWKLSQLSKKLNIDIIHTQYLRENYIALLSRLFNPKVKVMYTNHFILGNNWALRFSNRILTHLQANIIAVCNKGKEMMIANGNDGKKISVVYNGIDPEFWAEPAPSTLRSEFGIGEDEFVLFCMSRFAYDKGHKFLINSIAELKKITNEKFRLILANGGDFLEQTKQQVKDLGLQGEVLFIGFRQDIKNLLDGSDLYINSSQHEALSFAIIQALAAGVPVVATDMGGNRDIVNEETRCGLLVKYDDANDMAQAIKKVMEDTTLQKSMKKNALKAAKEKFSLDNMVSQAYNLYKKSCGL